MSIIGEEGTDSTWGDFLTSQEKQKSSYAQRTAVRGKRLICLQMLIKIMPRSQECWRKS